MLLAGIVGREGRVQTANLISSIFSSTGKKVSVIDSSNLTSLDSQLVKGYLQELERNHVDILIFKIDMMDIQKLSPNGLNFDVIIYTDKADDLDVGSREEHHDLSSKIFSLLHERGVVIVNVDDNEVIKLLQGMKHYTVTYGFNSKASLTTSSTGDLLFEDSVICCLQRTIAATNGTQVEPQEYRVRVGPQGYETRNILAAATFAVVNGIDLNMAENINTKLQ